ncbi:MAG: glycosyl transferase [Chitinivibrionia bacterium]|nr:glycosyl transferase [Chitinivibrionia bacterium]
MSIPKIIHYCWFGGNPLPNYAVKYIETWKKYFPDYKIIEWNENNYDVHKIPYTSEAYNAKKYAFVSDYARFDVLYEFGGIYFDVDVEVIKPFGEILNDTGFMGTESRGIIAAGLGMGCNAGLEVVNEILEHYRNDHFLSDSGINLKTVVLRITEILTEKGFDTKKKGLQKIAGFTIYPPQYFAPQNPQTLVTKIVPKTVSMHHYWLGDEKNSVSWITDAHKRELLFRNKFFGFWGDNVFSSLLFRVIIKFRLKEFVAKILIDCDKKDVEIR